MNTRRMILTLCLIILLVTGLTGCKGKKATEVLIPTEQPPVATEVPVNIVPEPAKPTTLPTSPAETSFIATKFSEIPGLWTTNPGNKTYRLNILPDGTLRVKVLDGGKWKNIIRAKGKFTGKTLVLQAGSGCKKSGTYRVRVFQLNGLTGRIVINLISDKCNARTSILKNTWVPSQP